MMTVPPSTCSRTPLENDNSVSLGSSGTTHLAIFHQDDVENIVSKYCPSLSSPRSSEYKSDLISNRSSLQSTSLDATNIISYNERKESPHRKGFERQEQFTKWRDLADNGWWWEIASTLLAITCTALIIAILLAMDSKPLSKWKLPIQPNSLVAVFSTVAKASLLYPLAECIGQLKWIYFEKPGKLDRIHHFDTASRGPWGAFMFVWNMKGTAALASMGALITVLMLAFEPFAQQVIAISSQNIKLDNVSASVLVQKSWSDILTQNSWLDKESQGRNATDGWNATQESIGMERGGILEVFNVADLAHAAYEITLNVLRTIQTPLVYQPKSFHCLGSRCGFPELTMLGVCSNCTSTNISNDFFDKCAYSIGISSESSVVDSVIDNEQELSRSIESEIQSNNLTYAMVACEKSFNDMIYTTSPFSSNYSNINVAVKAVFGVRPGETVTQKWSPGAESLHFCTHSSDMNLYSESSSSSLGTLMCFSSPTDMPQYENAGNIGLLNITKTNCNIDVCARKYSDASVENGKWTFLRVEHFPLKPDIAGETAPMPGLQESFRLGAIALNILKILFQQAFYMQNFQDSISSGLYAARIKGNWTKFSEEMAAALTIVMQSPDNKNATNITTNLVYDQAAFVQVRWPWLVGPLLLVVFSIGFLICTILQSRRKSYLFKTSILAVLYHGLEDCDKSRVRNAEVKKKETHGDLMDVSQNVRVVLVENERGTLKLKQE